MKITLVTLYDDKYKAVGEKCAASLHACAPEMGASVTVFDHLLDKSLHPAWNKILAVYGILAQADWVVWIDADCLVRRTFRLREFLDHNPFDLLCGADWNGLCSSVFAVKKSLWSFRFLEALLLCGDVGSNESFGHGSDGHNLGPKWEQNTIKLLMREFPGIASHIGFLHRDWVTDKPMQDVRNIYPVHHFGAVSIEEKAKQMSL